MSFRYRRDKPLPKGLAYGITSLWLESALVPAEPPESWKKSKGDAVQSMPGLSQSDASEK